MDFTFEKTGDVGVLTFDGKLTKGRADELKVALMLSLNNAGHVILNFEKVTELDDSCLGLLSSAYRVSMKLNKRITLTSISPGIFSRKKGNGGFPEVINFHAGLPANTFPA